MKNKKGIFSSLVKNYILFALASVILIIFVMFIILYRLGSSFNYYDLKLLPSQIVKSDYKKIDTRQVENLDGWVEILDENNRVIYVKGKKLDDKKSYVKEELIKINNPTIGTKNIYINRIDGDDNIITFSEPFKSIDGKQYICLTKYPKSSVNLKIEFKKFPENIEGKVYSYIEIYCILFVVLFIFNIILFSIWTSRKIGRPLNKIMQGIMRMQEENYNVRLDFKAEKEFVVIRDAFNLMTEKLNKSEEEKIKIEQRKNMMLLDLSHDIKTPITTIQNYSRALSEGLIEGDEKQLRYYNTIYQKSVRVNELVDDLFQFVKLESQEYKLVTKKVDFIEFTRRVVSEHYDEIIDKDIKLEVKIPNQEVFVEFDEKLISRAISNIITNAIKYNPNGTKLRIEICITEDKITLEIGDNGIGIPKDIQDNIFEIFVSGDKSRRSTSGTGLGLSISKRILEKHNWVLKLYNFKNEESTTFSIIIPNNIKN